MVLLVLEVWWAERGRKVYPGWMEFKEKMAVKECRESMVMMGRLVFLVKLAHLVKLAFQDSQEIRGPLDQRVSGVFQVRVDLQEKEASKVEWDCQGRRAIKDLKDNLVTQENQVFQGFWDILDQGGLQETLGQRAYGGLKGPRDQWVDEELLVLWELLVPVEEQVLVDRKAIVASLECKVQGDLLDLVDPLDVQVLQVSLCHLKKMVYCLGIYPPHSGLRISL